MSDTPISLVHPPEPGLVLAAHLMRESLVLLDEVGAARAATYLQFALDLLEGPIQGDMGSQRH